MSFKKAYKSYGDQAILIAWEPKIDTNILSDINQFKMKIETHLSSNIIDVVVGYHSLLVKYKERIGIFKNEVEGLEKLDKELLQIKPAENYLWEIPVCYDQKFGIDLSHIAITNKLSVSEIINLHSTPIYTVYFIGFLPGFLYLGGLNEQLVIPRKETPRLHVDERSVAIGGRQTGVYPSNSAGGWQIIGKTPISFFDVKAKRPCFAKSGDQIKFSPISPKEFNLLEYQNIKPKKIKLL